MNGGSGMRNKVLKNKSGFSSLSVVTGISVMLTITGAILFLGNFRKLQHSIFFINQSEGFYASEIAVWQNYALRGTPSNLNLDNHDSGSNPLIRRHLSQKTKGYSPGLNSYCGTATYQSSIGVKTCLTRPN
jgi:hypothetical protein